MTDEEPEEETYSLIYTSLNHPVRRKILRMLKNKPLTFSEMLAAVGIDSGHLNYHLENLGDLITHSQNGEYHLTSIGEAAVKLMGGVEEHSHELSKPKLKLSRVFAKVYPLVLSVALIIAGLYFIGYTATITTTANGIAYVFPNANITMVNATTTPFNQTVILLSPVNVTSFTAPGIINESVITLGTETQINTTTSWEQLEKPYFYYGIAGLIIGLVYPAFVLIDLLKNLRHKPKPQSTP